MSGIPLPKVSMTLPKDPRLFVVDHNRNLREANQQGMHLHHRRHIPWHFQTFAAVKYGYKPRNKKYLARKLKQKGHLLPMVFSGASRAKAMAEHTVSGTPKGAKLTFNLAIKGGITGRVVDAAAAARLFAAGKRKTAGFSQKQIDGQKNILMRVAEMQTIAVDEARAIAAEVKKVYVEGANKPGTKYRVRIK